MTARKVTRHWLNRYFSKKVVDSDIERALAYSDAQSYSSFWQTDGGSATRDFERLPEDEFDILFRTWDKTYWGKKR